MLEILQYDFVQRALIAGTLLSICSALIGCALISKRFALLSYSLSNLAFLAVSFAQALNLQALASSLLPVIAAAVYFLQREEKHKLPQDGFLALTANISLALGITIIAYSRGMTLDICNFMFGSVLVLRNVEVYMALILLSLALCTVFCLRKYLFAWQLDRNFYQAAGILRPYVTICLAALIGIVVAIGIRFMGTLLISSLLLLPPLSAMQLAKSYKQSLFFSVLIALFSFYTGIYFSYKWALPSGAAIVTVNACLFLCCKSCKSGTVLKSFVNFLPPKRSSLKVLLLTCLSLLFLVNAACSNYSGRQQAKSDDIRAYLMTENGDAATLADGQGGFQRSLGSNKERGQRTMENLAEGTAPDGSSYFPLSENNFVLLTNEIYTNYPTYLTKTLAYEGYLAARYDPQADLMRYFIIRQGPGCCSYDRLPGFEVLLPPNYAYAVNAEQLAKYVKQPLAANLHTLIAPAELANAAVQDKQTVAAADKALAALKPEALTELNWLLENEWLYCEGKLETYTVAGTDYLCLRLNKITQGRESGLLYVRH